MHLPKSTIFCSLIMCYILLLHSAVAKQRFCGDTLSDALDLICINGYNTLLMPPLRKRDNTEKNTANVNGDHVVDTKLTLTGRISPFFVKMHSNMLTMKRRQRSDNAATFRGIYDECCIQLCSFGELAAYCRSP